MSGNRPTVSNAKHYRDHDRPLLDRILSSIFGVIALKPLQLTWKTGALAGSLAFVCTALIPALGLPPQPPGIPVADIAVRQLWWVGDVVATAVAIVLIVRSRQVLDRPRDRPGGPFTPIRNRYSGGAWRRELARIPGA